MSRIPKPYNPPAQKVDTIKFPAHRVETWKIPAQTIVPSPAHNVIALKGDSSRLSYFQERLWLHYERNPEDTSWNLPLLLLIDGKLNPSALERSINIIATRHESLRTLYGEVKDGVPVQFVSPPQNVHLPVVPVNKSELLHHLDRFLEHRFDLRRGPIFTSKLLSLPTGQHLLLLNVHHIAADGWSLKAILLSELETAYAAFCLGQQPPLPRLSLQYKDYARTQRAADMSADTEYWTNVLKNYEDTLELPTTYPRQHKSGIKSGTFTYTYPPTFARNLERFSRENGSTMFMCLLAALGVTLSRYANKSDLCIGTTTSNRPQVELEPLIGFFVNILPLRLQIDENATVAELLKAVRTLVLTAFEHPVPFEQILQSSEAAKRGSEHPLVPIVMRHQNFPQASRTPLPGNLTFRSFPPADEDDEDIVRVMAREHVAPRCEIEMSYAGDADGLAVEVVFAAHLYSRDAVEGLLAHHQHVLEGMFSESTRKIVDITMLRDSDVEELVNRNECAAITESGGAVSVLERFDAQVDETPEAVACLDGDRSWTYLDISLKSHTIAQKLIERGTKPGDIVAVCLPRGGNLLSTFLGIWRAGAAYVPLDPSYPATYSQQIIDDTTPVIVICEEEHQNLFALDSSKFLQPEEGTDWVNVSVEQKQPLHPDSLAYVMYTSGSTGKPKGVRVPHRQLTNWLGNLERMVPFQGGEVVGQKTSCTFAVSVKEMFAGLVNGCSQVFIDDYTLRDVVSFVDTLAKHNVSRLNMLPSHLGSVMEYLKSSGKSLPSLRVCFTAGEPLNKSQVLTFRSTFPSARLFNNYGCTELNDICYYDTAAYNGTADFVPIGTPIANTKVYVMDRHGRLVPDGVAGELHVASVSLSEGYHGREDLTAERFLPNPFGSSPSAVLYNTGDIVRYLPDGTLEFIGRWDFQAKVRGYRIDVRQVEKVIGDFEGIRERAVVGRSDRLIAFYTCLGEKKVKMEELRAFLQERLPKHMVPDSFVLLERMPQLLNGKMNRKALLDAEYQVQQQSGGYEAPVSETERELAGIWAVIVNVPAARIGRQAHFFEIGGHSLSAMRVLARIKDTFRIELSLSELFDAPQLGALAAVIDRQMGPRKPAASSAVPPPKVGMGSGLLQGKVVLITGGSRGIGLATSLLLAEHGAKVAINYRDSKQNALSVKEMIEKSGGTAEVFGADVTNAEEVAAMVKAIHARFDRIDVLVANAHIHFRKQHLMEYEWADLALKTQSELKALFHPCQAVIPEMVQRKSGSIIALSSTLSKRANPGYLAQSIAKASVDAFVRSLSAELGPHGVRANTVAPGVTLTDAAMPMAPHVKESVANICPMRRNGLAEDMAGAILFLASDLARFMTGVYLPVDGGFTTL
ncbi:hypothetical protein HK097_002724 [Rhizophlyctis rosea]|uniref:Carrier domain-containing protein n=1 Tax=Rhizophlyctis rosea TaxID=64517 RepID=A0AAD5S394_9FUNG|nr:hypothetical protein HK097_002724 [Rhizophlyctis rosea]